MSRLPAAVLILLVTLSAVSAQYMAPGPAPYYNPPMGPSSSPGGGGGAGGEDAGAPAPAVDCMTQLFNLSDCLSYVTTGSNMTKPDAPCCPELAGLVDSNPICLCTLLTINASSYGFDIDRTRAFGLPSVCSVSTPPLSLCPGTESPMGAPSPSQAGGGGAATGDAPAGGPMMGPSPSSGESGGTTPSSHSSPTTASPKLSTHLLFTTTTFFLLLSTSFFHSN